jgi:hypothetical protein
VLTILIALIVFLAAFFWIRGWPFPALLLAAFGVFCAWAWFDNRFVYVGRRPSGGSGWRGPTPHEGWIENQADHDAWLGGG